MYFCNCESSSPCYDFIFNPFYFVAMDSIHEILGCCFRVKCKSVRTYELRNCSDYINNLMKMKELNLWRKSSLTFSTFSSSSVCWNWHSFIKCMTHHLPCITYRVVECYSENKPGQSSLVFMLQRCCKDYNPTVA